MFDADNDDDLDLYVVNGGGSEFKQNDENLCDLFYRNNDGKLEFDADAVPAIPAGNGTAGEIDFDSDGDPDLFVGGRLIPGKYPMAPSSYLLKNDEGRFTRMEIESMKSPMLINDVIASDIDNDGDDDLIAVGEWTGVILLRNNSGVFEQTSLNGAILFVERNARPSKCRSWNRSSRPFMNLRLPISTIFSAKRRSMMR